MPLKNVRRWSEERRTGRGILSLANKKNNKQRIDPTLSFTQTRGFFFTLHVTFFIFGGKINLLLIFYFSN